MLLFHTTLGLNDKSLVGVAPYSNIPTVFAIIVKLRWGALEKAFKRLQPYVMMTKEPTKVSRGFTLSYINSPMISTSGKALIRGHWLLALVCLGAFWTEVCKCIPNNNKSHCSDPVISSHIWDVGVVAKKRWKFCSKLANIDTV